MKFSAVAGLAILAIGSEAYRNEFIELPGHDVKEFYYNPLPSEYTDFGALPDDFNWANINGTSLITKSLNQHIPQYCGSCWAHGAMSSLADRIKIARASKNIGGPDINLAIQYILNCGTDSAGSCHGGSATGAYQFVQQNGFIPYDTCLQYEACSQESKEGNCKYGNYECTPMNTCRTCSTFSDMGGFCSELDTFPNATIAEYGRVQGEMDIMAELYHRGPVACGVDAEPLHNYKGGVYNDEDNAGEQINHIVAIVGWGTDKKTGEEYWIVRNSWGEYWGEMGFFRVAKGKNMLLIEQQCSWATPGTWTEHNYPCYEDGTNCVKKMKYIDPSVRKAHNHVVEEA